MPTVVQQEMYLIHHSSQSRRIIQYSKYSQARVTYSKSSFNSLSSLVLWQQFKILKGNSDITFAQKYGPTLYMLLFTSRRNTGRSSGKIRITFQIALKDTFIVIKKRAPWIFQKAQLYVTGFITDVSINAPACQNRSAAKHAVTIVVINFTQEV